MSKQTLAPIGALSGGETGTLAAGAGHIDFRRFEPRIHCDRQMSILRPGVDALAGAEGANGFITARLTDCSLNGLGMMTSAALEVGEQFFVRLKIEKLTLLVYTVRYCIPMKADEFRVGAKFTGYTASSFQGDMGAVITALTGGQPTPR